MNKIEATIHLCVGLLEWGLSRQVRPRPRPRPLPSFQVPYTVRSRAEPWGKCFRQDREAGRRGQGRASSELHRDSVLYTARLSCSQKYIVGVQEIPGHPSPNHQSSH